MKGGVRQKKEEDPPKEKIPSHHYRLQHTSIQGGLVCSFFFLFVITLCIFLLSLTAWRRRLEDDYHPPLPVFRFWNLKPERKGLVWGEDLDTGDGWGNWDGDRSGCVCPAICLFLYLPRYEQWCHVTYWTWMGWMDWVIRMSARSQKKDTLKITYPLQRGRPSKDSQPFRCWQSLPQGFAANLYWWMDYVLNMSLLYFIIRQRNFEHGDIIHPSYHIFFCIFMTFCYIHPLETKKSLRPPRQGCASQQGSVSPSQTVPDAFLSWLLISTAHAEIAAVFFLCLYFVVVPPWLFLGWVRLPSSPIVNWAPQSRSLQVSVRGNEWMAWGEPLSWRYT